MRDLIDDGPDITPLVLRDYQTDVIERTRQAIGRGSRRPLLVMPTGAGKTKVAAGIVESAVTKGKRVLFGAPRRDLIHQTRRSFASHGIESNAIMAGAMDVQRHIPVGVCSWDTVHSRCKRNETMAWPKADIVIVDEAHFGYLTISPGHPRSISRCGDHWFDGNASTG